jgi:AraC-like DNA-binding protein
MMFNKSKFIFTSLRLRMPFGGYQFNIFVIFCLIVVNIFYKLEFSLTGVWISDNLWSPGWLLLGPFVYFANNCLKDSEQSVYANWLHFLPALVSGLFFSMVFLGSRLGYAWFKTLHDGYMSFYYAVPISLMVYSGFVISDRTKDVDSLEPKYELLLIISGFYVIIAILSSMMFICWYALNIDMGFDYRYFTYGLLGVIATFILAYASLMTKMKKRRSLSLRKKLEHNYSNSGLGEEQAAHYKSQIRKYFESTECFLRTDLSLETLSKELDISKHYLSEIFNIHIGKSFYGFIAEYRISYAIERLRNEGGRLKIESLAHECGFNSKTSFNRYFKELTGFNPSEYISNKILDKETVELLST